MKVLIVDDEPLVRKSLARAFRAKGHDVVEAADGQEGLKQWQLFGPDIAFIDVLMPEMTGPQLLAKIGLRGKAKAVLMSAYSGEDQDTFLSKNLADLFIAKPFEDIFEVVKKAEKLYIPESI